MRLTLCPEKHDSKNDNDMKLQNLSWMPVILLVFGLGFATLRAQEKNINPASVTERPDWMGALPDSLPLCKVSLPGTHDSGAMYGGPSLQTQGTDIPAQLRQGIRAFDIRLQEKDGKLGVFHGTAFQQVYWETDVLPAFLHFLREHPAEVLVVSLKREGGAAGDYDALLSVSLAEKGYRSCFVENFRPDLTVGECRGKILFLLRDVPMACYPGAACQGWADDATCILALRAKDGQEGFALLQDEYQYGSDRESGLKTKACLRNFEAVAAEPDDSRRWGISFASATGLPDGTPQAFAGLVNPALAGWLEQEGGTRRGIVFIDFVEQEAGRWLVTLLIDGNFR